MIDFTPYLHGYLTTVSLQFGYMVFFSIYFPLGLFILLVANIVMVSLTAFAYSHHVKRSTSEESTGIGVWKDILTLMGYLGVIYNGLIVIFLGEGLTPLFGVPDQMRDILIVLIIEHVLLFFKALIGKMVADVPAWVSQRIQKEDYLEDRHQEKVITNYKSIKNQKKLADLFGEVRFGERRSMNIAPRQELHNANNMLEEILDQNRVYIK